MDPKFDGKKNQKWTIPPFSYGGMYVNFYKAIDFREKFKNC